MPTEPKLTATGSRNVAIPKRFEHAITLHIVRNLLASGHSGTPLILGIHGPSGEGKTFQTETILERLNVHRVTVGGHEFESDRAGAPAELILTRYREAGAFVVASGYEALGVLLINDFDAVIGNWHAQQTVNTQHVIATLMAIADDPVGQSGGLSTRIPIVITANDLTKIYRPLTRPSRMRCWEWILDREEKEEILYSLFADTADAIDLSRALLDVYPTRPIAFFAAVRDSAVDAALLRLLETRGAQETISAAIRSPEVVVDELKQRTFTASDILMVASERERAENLQDHLVEVIDRGLGE